MLVCVVKAALALRAKIKGHSLTHTHVHVTHTQRVDHESLLVSMETISDVATPTITHDSSGL